MKTKFLWILIGIVLIVANLCSANSLWKASPFDSERDNLSREEAVNRVNLWPLFYHYKPYTSALWPIFDKRDDGYALRPFFSVYNNGDELNILWPLSSFDFDREEYRIGTVFWKTNVLVAFPFYFYEKDDFWFAPLIAGKGKDWYSVMPPMWIHKYESTNDYSYFCMPLLTYFEREKSDYSLSTFPLYHQSLEGEKFNQKLLLFLYEYESSPEMKSLEFFPLLDYFSSSTKTNFSIFPVYSYKNNEKRKSHLMFPLFYKKKTPSKDTLITPLFGTLMGGDVSRVITPLVSVSHSRQDHFVNVLGLIYNHAWNDEEKYNRTDIIWPLFTHKRVGESRTVSSLPLFYYKKSPNNYKFLSFASFGKNRDKTFFNILGFLFHYSRDEKNKNRQDWFSFPLARFKQTEKEKSGFILWPLYNYNFEENGSYKNIIFPLCGKGKKIRQRRRYDGAVSSEEQTTQTWNWILPFTYWNQKTYYNKDYSVPVPNEIKTAKRNGIDWKKVELQTNTWKTFAGKYYKACKRKKCGSFPFFSYEENENIDSQLSILFWLYDSKWKSAEKDSQEKTHKRVLWRLMDYEKQGKNVSVDIFPFITYDKISEKEISQFSVLWRLFRWREEKEKMALDLFFIPFRWSTN